MGNRLRIALAATTLLTVGAQVATAGVTTHQTFPNVGRIGLSSHLIWISEPEIEAELSMVAAAGVRQVREDFLWAEIQPTATTWDWSRTDNLMTAASRTRVNVLGILDYSAPWASSSPIGDTGYPPRRAGDYATYAAAVASRYGPGGSFWIGHANLTPLPLGALEIWNEPFGFWAWKPNPDPIAYAALARQAADAIRAVNPTITLVLPGDAFQARTDGASVAWLDNVLTAEPTLGSLIDAYSVHPYPSPRDKGPYGNSGALGTNYERVTATHSVAVAHGADHPIWITEIGWSTTTAAGGVSEATQKTYVEGAITRAMTEWPYVDKVFIYTWDRDNGVPTSVEGNFGMRRSDGSFKPAWDAVKAAAARWPVKLA
jgi:hypothetical protein